MNSPNRSNQANITGEIHLYDDYSNRRTSLDLFGSKAGIWQNKYFPYFILLAGIVFLIVLLSMTHPGVFFSGDGGLKYLMVEQLQYSSEYKSIHSNHPVWVQDLWGQGYYPFKPAFVYTVNNEHLVAFPVIFQFLNSFFVRQFGFYGIYIIPAVSVLLTWISFIRILNVLKTNVAAIGLGIFLLAFCSPLTFYAAVYWEHSLATFLVFNGVVYFLQKKSSLIFALISGLLCGMAMWFREEAIILLGLIIMMIAWNSRKGVRKADILFVAAAGLSVSSYFLFNYLSYGALFGVHSYQVMRDMSLGSQSLKGLKQLFKMNAAELISFPLLAVSVFVLFNQYKQKNKSLFQLALIIFLYIFITPFAVPSDGDKQWGVRFFLPVVPPVLLVVALFAGNNNWLAYLEKYRRWAILFLLVIIYSVYLNVYKAGTVLKDDYSKRVYPALQYLNNEPCKNVVIDNQYIAQELTTKFMSKNFFLVNNEEQMANLLRQLKAAGQQECIFMSMNKDNTVFPQSLLDNRTILWRQSGDYYMGIYKLP